MTGVGDSPRDLESLLRAQGKKTVALERARNRGVAGALRRIWERLNRDSTIVGEIKLWPVSTAPEGYLILQGQAVSRTTYSALFALLGTAYGSGDGTSTFNLPDMRGRVPVGLDVGQAEFNALGKRGGAKTHTLSQGEMPSHTHYIDGPVGGQLSGTSREPAMSGSNGAGYMPWFGGGWGAAAARVAASGSSQPHNNLQPYATLNYIIKAV